jgi:hypothetical protein
MVARAVARRYNLNFFMDASSGRARSGFAASSDSRARGYRNVDKETTCPAPSGSTVLGMADAVDGLPLIVVWSDYI